MPIVKTTWIGFDLYMYTNIGLHPLNWTVNIFQCNMKSIENTTQSEPGGGVEPLDCGHMYCKNLHILHYLSDYPVTGNCSTVCIDVDNLLILISNLY